MQIDWITVAAQIVNFLILVWLLNRFLYGPITRAMQRREEQIQSRLDDAAEQREKAEDKQRELDQKLGEIESTREEKLDAVRKDADDLKRQLENEAREEVDQKREDWLAELQGSREEFISQLRQKVAGGFRDLADEALASLADTTLTERMADTLAERLKALDGDDLERLRSAIAKTNELVVVSGQSLDAGIKRKLTRAIHDTLEDAVEVHYEDEGDGLVGIKLRANNVHLEWTLDAHLDQFAERLREEFPERVRKEKVETGNGPAEGVGNEHPARADSRQAEATHE